MILYGIWGFCEMTEKIKILMNGAAGKMGKAMCAGLMQEPDMQIVAAVDVRQIGADIGLINGFEATGVLIEDNLEAAIKTAKPQVVVEFTNPQVVFKNIKIALQLKVPVVVGGTGLDRTNILELEALSQKFATPVFIAPNFALGAVLMMRFAKEAAAYFPQVEVIERHHDQKLDAPSGTALKTLEMISEVRPIFAQGNANEFEKINGARGGDYQGIRVHSMRLPGYVATQEVVFGGLGQILTIKHDAMARESFLPGLVLALRRIFELSGVVVGLEKLL